VTYADIDSQAIAFTAGVPPVAAAKLIASGEWDVKGMVNVEELDPIPFFERLAEMGISTEVYDLSADKESSASRVLYA
jgi:saccharopine dehydrogenase-like NADP-dependent oxidoreductase